MRATIYILAFALCHEAVGLFQYRCTNGVSFGGVKEICDYSASFVWILEHEYSCEDRSDNEYCSDDWVFNGCLSYEGRNILRIVPCNECICHLTGHIGCLHAAKGNPECKLCLTSSSMPEEGKTCGYQFEGSNDFLTLLKDRTRSVHQKRHIMEHGDWKCRDAQGNIALCARRETEYFLYSYDKQKIYQCSLHFWTQSDENKCIRKPYAYKNSCPRNLKLCGEKCTPPKEPCQGKCRDNWVTCLGKKSACYPDYNHCCSVPNSFFCEATN